MYVKQRLVFTPQKIVTMALLISIAIICTRFLSIKIGSVIRISFTFIPIAFSAITMGMWPAAIIAAMADVIGAILFPSGAFFPGYTLSAFLGGMLYGLFFYQKKITILRILVCKLCIDLLCNLILNTLWISITGGSAFFALLPARAIKNLIEYPVHVGILFFISKNIHRIPKSLKLFT